MDVSVAGHQSEPNHAAMARQSLSTHLISGDATSPSMPAPRPQIGPIRYGLLIGLAAAASVALTACCLVSVAGRLGPGRRYLNGGIIVFSVFVGVYVGFRAWQKQKVPRPISTGRCPDCGRETIAGEDRCSLCGRPAHGI